MTANHRHLEDEDGFTLIELLVVILIIGILAAIALPSFLGQREKGQDACAKAMTKTMQTALFSYQTDNGSFAGATAASLNLVDGSITNGQCAPTATVNVYGTLSSNGVCNAGTVTSLGTYCVSYLSQSGVTFAISETGSTGVQRTCSIPSKGGCKAGGVW